MTTYKKASRANYDAVCHDLGFNADVHFVEITTRGTITFTVGKPNEIRALYRAVLDKGYKPARELSDTASKL